MVEKYDRLIPASLLFQLHRFAPGASERLRLEGFRLSVMPPCVRPEGIDRLGERQLCDITPPSTMIPWPVMKRASSEARKANTSAMSSGWPRRPSGQRLV